MKVFISHSSPDKWAARRIADELANIGVDSFLDEKDVDTGDSIDDAIQQHLSECDDFLILLSPISIKSHWVLVELGGAMALKKRLVPILFYLGANEIPKPITKHLARDINDIERYYEEVKKRLIKPSGTAPEARSPTRRKPPRPRLRSLSVGDQVRVVNARPYDASEPGWMDEMDQFTGAEAVVVEIDESDRTAKIDVDGGDWWWAWSWLLHKK